MVQKSGKSNPLMNEGAGGADVPQALFYLKAIKYYEGFSDIFCVGQMKEYNRLYTERGKR